MTYPLRKRTPDGSVYRRPTEIEDAITALTMLPPVKVAERSRIADSEAEDYVPSECVLYLVRHPALLGNEELHRELFVSLRQRVLLAVPVFKRHLAGSRKDGEDAVDLEIREAVLDRFQELICADRLEYEERLDFYECRFNMAIDRLRTTAQKPIRDRGSRTSSATSLDESNEPTEEIESALRAMKNAEDGEKVDFLYRLKLRTAINSLPPDERRIIELYFLDEVPIESNDGEVITIVKILRCTEKTVRNRRDRALQRLREALTEEDA